jgi:hypothetical protein
MGRHKKYLTQEQQDIARRERQMKYHRKNRDKRNTDCLNRYYKNKN